MSAQQPIRVTPPKQPGAPKVLALLWLVSAAGALVVSVVVISLLPMLSLGMGIAVAVLVSVVLPVVLAVRALLALRRKNLKPLWRRLLIMMLIALGSLGGPPPIKDYLEKVVRFAMKENFGDDVKTA